MANQSAKVKAYLGLFLMTTIIGLSFIFVKIGLRYSNSIDLLAHRFGIAFLTILILKVFGVLKLPKINWEKVKGLIVLSLFYPVFFFLFQTYGMNYSTATEAGIIYAMSPIFMLIFAQIFLKEKSTLMQKIGVVLSIVGVLYIIFNKAGFSVDFNHLKGVLLLLLSVISFVGYIIMGKKVGASFSAIEITVWITLIAFIVFTIWGLSIHLNKGTLSEFYQPFSNVDFIYAVLYLGVLSSVVTSFLTNYSLPLIPASHIAVMNNFSPIMAVLGGVLFLDEQLHYYHIIGGVLVALGIFITLKFKEFKE